MEGQPASHAGHVKGPGAKAQSECRSIPNKLYNLRAVNHFYDLLCLYGLPAPG
jgi:hypothetical protein